MKKIAANQELVYTAVASVRDKLKIPYKLAALDVLDEYPDSGRILAKFCVWMVYMFSCILPISPCSLEGGLGTKIFAFSGGAGVLYKFPSHIVYLLRSPSP
jgi:hypothetical protein